MENTAPANTGNVSVTREIAKELSFEDISVHSPGLWREADAMRLLREGAPSAGALRGALMELDATSESLGRVLENAKDMMGNSQQDLERIKTNIKRLKFGTIELSTEQAFLRAILEARPLPRDAPTESEAFKENNAALKSLKDANDAAEKEVEATVEAVGESAAAFAAEHAALAVRVETLDALEAEAEAAELACAGISAGAEPDPADAHLSDAAARAALDQLMAESRGLNAQLKSRESEAAAIRAALEPDEAALASVKAELKLLAGAQRSHQREAAAMGQIAETRDLIAEQIALVEHLHGVKVQQSVTRSPANNEPSSPALTLRLTTHVPPTPASAFDGNVAPAPPAPVSRVREHVMTVTFHPGSTAVAAVHLEPPDTCIDDVAAAARAAGATEDALKDLVTETRVRIAAAAARAEALTAAARETPLEWSAVQPRVLARLYDGQGASGGVAAVDVPLEWPLNGARVRVTGLAGLAPAVVAAAAARVDPGGYLSVPAALRATRDALAAAGHFPAAA